MQHYDLDNGRTTAIWAVDKSGRLHRSWWPAVFSMWGGVGLAVELVHGTLVSWDARVLKHCSIVPGSEDGDVYGMIFFSV